MQTKTLKRSVAALILAASCAGPVMAQTTQGNSASQGSSEQTEHHDYGWIGLLGLVGLAGFMRRSDRSPDVTRRTVGGQ